MTGPVEVGFKEPMRMQAWLVTEDNIRQVAAWCGGVVDGDWIHFTGHRDVGFGVVGEYVMKGENFFSMDSHWFGVHYVVAS